VGDPRGMSGDKPQLVRPLLFTFLIPTDIENRDIIGFLAVKPPERQCKILQEMSSPFYSFWMYVNILWC
jgi:hypothetical protein